AWRRRLLVPGLAAALLDVLLVVRGNCDHLARREQRSEDAHTLHRATLGRPGLRLTSDHCGQVAIAGHDDLVTVEIPVPDGATIIECQPLHLLSSVTRWSISFGRIALIRRSRTACRQRRPAGPARQVSRNSPVSHRPRCARPAAGAAGPPAPNHGCPRAGSLLVGTPGVPPRRATGARSPRSRGWPARGTS